jgi:hypothetical protein
VLRWVMGDPRDNGEHLWDVFKTITPEGDSYRTRRYPEGEEKPADLTTEWKAAFAQCR